MQQVDQIIKARWIITVNSQNEILEDQALLIKEGKITGFVPNSDVGKSVNAKEIIEVSQTHALLPGFVNAHTHAAMNLLRGLADDLTLMDWLQNHIWPAEAKVVSPEFVRAGMRHACAEMLRGGITCFNDHYFFTEAAAQIVDQIGMRAILAECLFTFSVPWSANYQEGLQRTLKTYEQYKDHELIKIALAPHSPYATNLELLKAVTEISAKHDLLVHIHMHEPTTEVPDYIVQHHMRPLKHFEQMGFLSTNWLSVHMCYCNEEDIEILSKHKLSVVHCPESNMKLASNICPVDALLKRGVNVALGTDSAASNNDLDMIGEMRSACFLAKTSTRDPTAVSANDALRMATINGAKALKLDERIGSLEIGKDADMSAIDLSSIETEPLYHPVPQIIYAGSRKDISHVWVKGRALLQERELTTIDLNEVRTEIEDWQGKIKQL